MRTLVVRPTVRRIVVRSPGPQGVAGPAGPAGPQGPPGTANDQYIDDLLDVAAASPARGQFLAFDGGTWVPSDSIDGGSY
jgi:hypothetical protein